MKDFFLVTCLFCAFFSLFAFWREVREFDNKSTKNARKNMRAVARCGSRSIFARRRRKYLFWYVRKTSLPSLVLFVSLA
jgi:hypothetical protein